ncbi:MAG: hypothetical protein NUK65_11865 [Firmicutes bacterium]|nr:hypothetical protein [Bacillota bacterium]
MKGAWEKTIVLISILLVAIVTYTVSRGENKPPPVAIASDACVVCHISPEIINSLYTPPEVAGGGGG